MKKLFKLNVVALLLMLSINAAGSPASVITVLSGNSEEFIFAINGIGTENVKIIIKDARNHYLYSEEFEIMNTTYSRAYDMKSLPKGNYYVEIENDYMIEIYTVTITSNKLITDNDKKAVIFKPQVVHNGDTLDVGYVVNSGSKLKMTIANSRNDIIYVNTVTKDQSDSKRYDLSQLLPGLYTLYFEYAGRSYSKTIIVK